MPHSFKPAMETSTEPHFLVEIPLVLAERHGKVAAQFSEAIQLGI